jgi:desampylase
MWEMKLNISRDLQNELRRFANEAECYECCGLMIGSQNTVARLILAPNVAADTSRSFEIDPAYLIAAHKKQRAGAGHIIGYFHFHPNGVTGPSERDAQLATPDGMIWVIIANKQLSAWRAVNFGAHLGRFDPLEIICSA